MKSVKSIISVFSILLLVCLLVNMYVFYWDSFSIPKHIPGTRFNISGFFLIVCIIFLFITAEKKILRIYPEYTVLKLTLCGALIGFSAEIIYKAIQLYIGYVDGHGFFRGIIGIGIYQTVIAFLIAFQLKTKRTNQLIWFIIVIALFINAFYIIENGWEKWYG